MQTSSGQAFRDLSECFRQAAAAEPPQMCDLVVAGRAVRVSVSGQELAAALRGPVKHLERPAAEPDLTLEVWSVSETGIEPPLPEISDDEERHGDPDDALRVSSGDGRYFRYERKDACEWLDLAEGRAVCWFRSPAALSLYERGRPLHPLLLPWLEPQSRWILHAGLVSSDGKGVLLPGRGGRGKTTATVACALAGMAWAADDVAIVERAGLGRWIGHGIYSTAKLAPEQIERFGELGAITEPAVPGDEGAKRLVHLGEAIGDRAIAAAELSAIAVPTIGNGPSRIEPMGGAETLRELINGTVSVTAKRERPALFSALGELVAELPAYRLFLGPDMDVVPGLISGI